MFVNTYLFCGMLHSVYTFTKISNNYEHFLMMYEKEFGDTNNLKFFLAMLFISCIVAWPILMIQEINNKEL